MNRKKIINYWLPIGVMSAYILLGAAMDISLNEQAVAIITHLGYPLYFVPFIGALKIAGIIAILLPGVKKLKEWAFAGLIFDTGGAIFSHIASGDSIQNLLPAVLGLILVGGAYYFFTKWHKEKY